MISLKDYSQVFPIPEVPTEINYEISADWLLSHAHKDPSQRVKVALKVLSRSKESLNTLFIQYQELMKNDINSLNVSHIDQLKKIKEYFLFPLYYLSLSEYQFVSFERCLNSLIRNKVKSLDNLSADNVEFLRSVDWDLHEVSILKQEDELNMRVDSYRSLWERSVFNELESSALTRKKLSKLRINEIYEIVMNYPKSIPALYDLKLSIDPSQRSLLINSFILKCHQNLLHAGTNTHDIILFFVLTIQSFLIIDPRSVLLDIASRPIRKYLKERTDTIRNIVHGLLNYKSNPLHFLSDELSKPTHKTVNNLTLDWLPDPIDALPDFRKQDIIESLISIFESKEVFITELSKEFSKELLSIQEYNIEDIELKLRQLKWKFDENDLNNLDIMIKDVLDSEIIDSKIHDENKLISPNLHFSILSHLYWPELDEDNFNLPPEIEEQIDLYFMDYKLLKKGRKLSWIDSGVVAVELELSDRVISLNVSPAQASVIYCFNDDHSALKLSNIAGTLKMDESLAEKALQYWVKMGVLQIENGEYRVLEVSNESLPVTQAK